MQDLCARWSILLRFVCVFFLNRVSPSGLWYLGAARVYYCYMRMCTVANPSSAAPAVHIYIYIDIFAHAMLRVSPIVFDANSRRQCVIPRGRKIFLRRMYISRRSRKQSIAFTHKCTPYLRASARAKCAKQCVAPSENRLVQGARIVFMCN